MKTLFICVNFLILISCSKNDSWLKSKDIEDKEVRVKNLKKEIKFFSEVNNADYDLFNVNGFNNNVFSFFHIPGASSLHYIFVVKVEKKDLYLWLQGFKRIDKKEKKLFKWVDSIKNIRGDTWKTWTEPKYYKREDDPNVSMVVFEEESFIFKEVIQH